MVCSICGSSSRVRVSTGYCLNHHRRFQRYGNPLQFYDSMGDTPAERFWSQIALTADDNRCWNWTGKVQKKGYGRKKYQGTMRLVHHIAWHLMYGTFPVAEVLRHRCDNPRCVNPKHLLEGTHFDNVRDRQERQRQARGDTNARAKLTSADVPVIRDRLNNGEQMTDIARDYNIGPTAIFAIKRGITWRHI